MSTYLIGGRLIAGGGLEAGQITLRQLLTVSSNTELVLNDMESIDAVLKLPLRDDATGVTIDLAQQLVPGRDFVGIMVGDRLLAAGPVWADPYTAKPKYVRIVAAGLWSYFDHRYVLPVLAPGQLPRDVTSRWEGLSLRTIAKRLVQQACAHPGAGLPIDFEDDILGDHEREYLGADGVTVGDALRRLTDVEGGPDIAFRPYITSDRRFVRWSLATGSPELTQAGEDWYWDVSSPTPHAVMPSLERDGRRLHSRRFQTGATVKNELNDPSFEEGTPGWAVGTNATAYTPITGGSPVHGSGYGRWASVAAGWSFLDSTKAVSAEPGERFLFAVSCRGATARPSRVLIRFRDSEGATLLDSYSPTVAGTTSPTWQIIEHAAVAPSNTASVQVYIGAEASAGGQAFAADAASLYRTFDNGLPFAVDQLELQARADSDLLLDAGFPLLEDWENRSTVLRESTLQGYADEGVLRGSSHVETRKLLAKRYAHPALGMYQPGDYARIRQAANARGPEETVRERIIRVSFRSEGDVDIDLAPQRVVSGYPIPSSGRRWLPDQLAALQRRISESKG